MYTNSKGTRGQTQAFITVCLCEFESGCEMWLHFSKALTNEESLRITHTVFQAMVMVSVTS